MFRRLLIAGAFAGLMAGSSMAQDMQTQIIQRLSMEGYAEITIARTWLGRVRIVAIQDGLRREIVFNPATGEILRDLIQRLERDQSARSGGSGSSGSSGSGKSGSGNSGPGGGGSGNSGPGGGDDDDDDDDEDDDEDDDDDDEDDDDEDDDEEDD